MTIGVVVPFYFGGDYVDATLSSLVDQTIDAWRAVVVIDGASSDELAQLERWTSTDPRISTIRTRGAVGPAGARNIGAAALDEPTDMLMFLDCDDILVAEAFEQLRRALIDTHDAVAVHGLCRYLGNDIAPHRPPDITAFGRHRRRVGPMGKLDAVRLDEPTEFECLVVANWISTPGQALVLRAAFDAVGGFDEAVPRAIEDWDLWLRLSAMGPIGFVDSVVLEWRQHAASLSSDGQIMSAREDAYRTALGYSTALTEEQREQVRVGRTLELRRRSADKLKYARDDVRRGRVLRAGRQVARSARLAGAAHKSARHSTETFSLSHAAEAASLDVVIATRNRHQDLRRALRSLSEQTDDRFRVFVIDQSDDATINAGSVAELRDARFTHVRSTSRGRSRAMNEAIMGLATADRVAFTDDDCELPPEWVGDACHAFDRYPSAGIVFGQLVAVEHDAEEVFIPAITFEHDRMFSRPLLRSHGLLGMGASMLVRRSTFELIGAFDIDLGVGSTMRSGEECDLMYRALEAGVPVVQTTALRVMHWGARPWADGSADVVLNDGFYGLMAGHGKRIRGGSWRSAAVTAHETFWLVWTIVISVARGRRPFHVRRLWILCRGLVAGLGRGPAVPALVVNPTLASSPQAESGR